MPSPRDYYFSDDTPHECFLLDTNVISEVVSRNPHPSVMKWLDTWDISQSYLSVMTIGEIRNGINRMEQSKRRARLESWLEDDVRDAYKGRILSIDASVADCWGKIMAEYKHTSWPIDMLFAATALTHNMTLVTRNEKHFTISNLRVMNPWTE